MELYEVTMQYADRLSLLRGGVTYVDVFPSDYSTKMITRHVAVYNSHDLPTRVWETTLRGLIGAGADLDKWEPICVSMRHIGTVYIEESAT